MFVSMVSSASHQHDALWEARLRWDGPQLKSGTFHEAICFGLGNAPEFFWLDTAHRCFGVPHWPSFLQRLSPAMFSRAAIF